MKTKKFLVQFRFDDNTRWKYDDSDTCYQIAMAAACVGSFQTDGPVPECTVIADETQHAAPITYTPTRRKE